jgi:hypothetical protein
VGVTYAIVTLPAESRDELADSLRAFGDGVMPRIVAL